ncbi:MAG: ParB/RepB/Spo0J family partition protein [Epsilonproteobacteria bacterium]|nr:ParB/RepB/Spo0J family partition protein [Campylobacterota bacterium]
MGKRKINAAKLLDAGKDAHLQTNSLGSMVKTKAEKIDGEHFSEIAVDKIINNPLQPRLHIKSEELQDLIASIKLHGLIQPIAVIATKEGNYVLKAGQRRWLAHQKLGLQKIKAIIEDQCDITTPEGNRKLFEIAVLENTQRDNLYPLELALALRQALDKKLYQSNSELSLALGKNKSYISKILKVLTLNETIIEDLKNNRSTNDIEALYEIQKIKEAEKQISIYFDFVNKKLTRADIRKIFKEQGKTPKQEFFELNANEKALNLKVNLETLNSQEKETLRSELQKVIDKYQKN